MTTDQNKLVVRRYIEEVANTGNVDRLAEFISPEYVEIYRGTRYSGGLERARKHVLDVRQTYPDLHLTIDRQIAEGDWVVTQVTAKGHASCVLARHEADRQRRRNHCRQRGSSRGRPHR